MAASIDLTLRTPRCSPAGRVGYLDRRWSPEQAAHALGVDHGVVIATETINQALYSPQRVPQRDPQTTLRTRRPNRRRRRRGDVRLGRFVVPLTMIDDRPDEARDRQVLGHWEGDLVRHDASGNTRRLAADGG